MESQPELPRLFAGRFVLVGEPVAGGMASVWKAYDSHGQFGEVALKVLPVGASDFHVRSFERERRAHERLKHPNVAELLGGGTDPASGQSFLIFPWLSKRPLDRYDALIA